MSIPGSVYQACEAVTSALLELEARVLPRLENVASEFKAKATGRIKPIESICDKMQRGELARPLEELDDLYAAQIVVRCPLDVAPVAARLGEEFDVLKTIAKKTKRPTEFLYDDLHLIACLHEDERALGSAILSKRFEIQVKTVLQAALTTITHDPIYKGSRECWRLHRLDSRIRAALEMIDESVDEIMQEQTYEQSEDFPLYRDRNKIITDALAWWQGDRPKDLRRAAGTIESYLKLSGVSVNEFATLLQTDEALPFAQLRSFTLVQAVLMALLKTRREQVLQNLPMWKKRLFIPKEMIDFCPEADGIDAQFLVSY